MVLGPRLVVAGTHSGVGKTTVATGLMAALRARSLDVAPAKVGPDFIDPSYHALACGRPGRNLDAWMSGPALIAPLAARAAIGADILVVEGVMGLFDGAADGSLSSTADIAHLLDAPVVLVVDCSAQAGSVAALVHGFSTFDERIRIAGVVLNQLGSAGHETMVREALAAAPHPIAVVGALHRDERFSWRDRHLGLIPVAEDPERIAASLAALSAVIEAGCDMEAVEAIARAAPTIAAGDIPAPRRVGSARIAVATGRAFTFSYPDNNEALASAGAEIVPFDPLHDTSLPADIDAVVIGGGFPEVMAEQLSANAPLLAEIRRRIANGLVTWAECGGLLWLAQSLDGHHLAAVVPAQALMTKRLTLGYRTAVAQVDNPLGPAGTELRGHEFHYSAMTPPGDALELAGRFGQGPEGFATSTMLATYLHIHLAARPDIAEHFVSAAIASGAAERAAVVTVT